MLTIYEDLFLNLNDLPYCHWKSNEHLGAGVNGKTDLDILIDDSISETFKSHLLDNGFKRFKTAQFRTHPSIEHYIGCDRDSTELVHIHLHYGLIIGGDLKEYHVPWEDHILDTRVRDEETALFVADPNMEMLLLLVRCALKLRWVHRVMTSNPPYPGDDLLREYRWLQLRIDPVEVEELSKTLIGEEAADPILALINDLSIDRLQAFQTILETEFGPYRRHSRWGTFLRAKQRRIVSQISWWSKDFNRPYLFHRTVPTGGVIIAILGPDGSGKSTIAADLEEWLGWKIDVYSMYLGSSDEFSLRKRLLQGTKDFYKSVFWRNTETVSTSSPNVIESNSPDESESSRIGEIYETLWALTVSTDKRKKLDRIWKARNKGAVVVTDRYPQDRYPGLNDGPLLNAWGDSDSRIHRWLASREATSYQWAMRNPPDLVIKLDVDPEVAAERAGDIDADTVARKRTVMLNLEYDGTESVIVDANRSIETVTQEVRRAAWKAL